MTSFVPVRALVVVAIVFASFFAAPREAHASDGYEVGFVAAGVMVPTLALDVTFIVASATGLTYDDEGWAVAQTIWSVASLGGCVAGFAYGVQQPGFEGLAGGMLMLGGLQAIFLGFAIHALARQEWDYADEADPYVLPVSFSLAPQPGGAIGSLSGTF
ncbi:MAG: hypothetical protein J0L92_04860 [Deltaproteobacteria bacterium]|nr:hypothetical protein [Deltaproteobacteria bacterium]